MALFYRQRCLNRGNSPATVTKKLTEIKCVFNAAIARNQLDENPLGHIKMPKCPQNEINIYSNDEFERILKAARDLAERLNARYSVRNVRLSLYYPKRTLRELDNAVCEVPNQKRIGL